MYHHVYGAIFFKNLNSMKLVHNYSIIHLVQFLSYMNIWFRTSTNKGQRSFMNSHSSSLNTSLPVIAQASRKNNNFHDDDSDHGSLSTNKDPPRNHKINLETSFQHSSSSLLLQNKKRTYQRQSSSQHENCDTYPVNEIIKTGKSVRFNLTDDPSQKDSSKNLTIQRSGPMFRTKSSFYGGRIVQNQQQQLEENSQRNDFLQFRYIKNAQDKRSSIFQNSAYTEERGLDKEDQDNTFMRDQHSKSISIAQKGSSIIKKDKVPSVSAIQKTGCSINSVNFLGTETRQNQSWNRQTKQSLRSIEKNSLIKTTGRKQNIKQHIISIIQYCSNEVGMAIYNTTNGQIFLCQIIERLTYFRTISTIERFYPLQIIYSSSLERTPLIKKINERFRNTNLRNFRRNIFDQTKGYQIYNQRGSKQQYNPDNKFVAFSALNALIFFLQNNHQTKFNYSTLKIRWHLLQDLLIIESQTIFSLEIFLNAETKQKQLCFIDNFRCLTYGGTRMLRANLLQPLSNEQMIKSRQDLVQIFLDDKTLYDTMCEQVAKFKNFQIITAKFIQMPKEKHIKSLKSYLAAIYSISHMCLLLNNFHKKIEGYKSNNLPIIGKLFNMINDIKITQLNQNIQSNFDEQHLKSFETGKSIKRENFIFLFKMQRIQDDFIEVMRITYSHTMEDILRIFKIIKEKSGADIKLLYNQFRGYYIKCNKKINLNELSQKIEDDIIQINERKDSINFSTSILVSLNNRLKESQKKLILVSQSLLVSIIEDVQRNIDILFDINYEMSVVDMILSFVGFIKKFNMVQFTRPILSKDSNEFLLSGLKTVWTIQSKFKISDQGHLNVGNSKKIVVFQKKPNSFQQLNFLYSIGYLTILTQIGCFVPALSFKTDIYHTLLSKIHLMQSIQSNLSHFQLELYHVKNVMDNVLHKNAKCLILLDELVKGTQYEEEVSISLALLNQLSKISGKSFIITSDIYQINVIKKLENMAKNHQKNEDRKQLQLNHIQIQQDELANQVQTIMERFNFSNQFIDHFKRLSIRQQKTRLFS